MSAFSSQSDAVPLADCLSDHGPPLHRRQLSKTSDASVFYATPDHASNFVGTAVAGRIFHARVIVTAGHGLLGLRPPIIRLSFVTRQCGIFIRVTREMSKYCDVYGIYTGAWSVWDAVSADMNFKGCVSRNCMHCKHKMHLPEDVMRMLPHTAYLAYRGVVVMMELSSLWRL